MQIIMLLWDTFAAILIFIEWLILNKVALCSRPHTSCAYKFRLKYARCSLAKFVCCKPIFLVGFVCLLHLRILYFYDDPNLLSFFHKNYPLLIWQHHPIVFSVDLYPPCAWHFPLPLKTMKKAYLAHIQSIDELLSASGHVIDPFSV